MAKWQYTRAESWRYPSLGFAATFGDVLEADFAPDANWDEVDGGTAATLPPVDTSNFTEPAAGTIPVYNAVTNRAEYKTLAELELLTQTEQDARYAGIGDPRLGAFKSALDAGRSAALWFTGDSTIDSAGAGTEMVDVLAETIASAYPTHHVRILNRNDSTDKWDPAVVVQAGAGQRHAVIGVRSMRHQEAAPSQFTDTANAKVVEVEVDVEAATWTPAASATLVTRGRKEVAGSLSNELQFWFFLGTAGQLQMHASRNGTSYEYQFASKDGGAAPVPVTGGLRKRLKAVMTIYTGTASGTGGTCAFYTSDDDGATWTQLGVTQTTSWPTTGLWTVATGAFFEFGASAWHPAGTPATGMKFFEVAVRDGVAGATMTPATPEQWERYGDTSTTFGGSPTVTLVNAGRSGSAMSYHTDAARLGFETADHGAVVLFFSDSHNETSASGPVGWTSPYQAWVEAVQARLPEAAVAVVKQNPHTSAWVNEASYGYSHKQRLDELGRLAAKNGWSIIDLYSEFLAADPDLDTLIGVDGLHPTAAGYALSAQVIAAGLGIR